jgi:hypothetical protein
MQKRWTFTWLVVLGLTLVAIGAAVAQAATRPDDRAGLRGVAPDQSDVISRYLIRQAGSTAVRPDDRAGPLGVGTPEPSIQIVGETGGNGAYPQLTAGEGFSFKAPSYWSAAQQAAPAGPMNRSLGVPPRYQLPDTGNTRSPGAGPKVDRLAVGAAASRSGGFDWGDAIIGAGAMLGIVLLVGGSLVTSRQNRRREVAGA